MEYMVTHIPEVSIFGDGMMVSPGAQIMIYPPPALPSLVVTKLNADGIQAIEFDNDVGDAAFTVGPYLYRPGSRLLTERANGREIALSDTKIRFAFGSTVLTSKLIDGTFPDYERVIPAGNDKVLEVDCKSFAEAVDRVSTISSEKSRAVKLAVHDGALTLSANSPENGTAVEELEVDYDGGGIEIGFNSRYLLDIASQIEGDGAEFAMADASSARDLILATQFGSGRHYLVADESNAFGIEGAGDRHQIVYSGETDNYVHTNHCLDTGLGQACRVPPASTTYDRYRILDERFARGVLSGMDEAWQLLGSHDGYPKSICTNMTTPQTPHGVATCAAVAFDHRNRQLWACAGFPHHALPELFRP